MTDAPVADPPIVYSISSKVTLPLQSVCASVPSADVKSRVVNGSTLIVYLKSGPVQPKLVGVTV